MVTSAPVVPTQGIPSDGQLVTVRQRRYVVTGVEPSKIPVTLASSLLAIVVQPASKDRVRALLARWCEAEVPVPPIAVAWALRAASAGDAWHKTREQIDLVWTGPATLSQGVYRTHQTLLDVIHGATRSLLIVTFAAYRVADVREALRAAAERSVDVVLVVETDEGPGGKTG